MDYLEVCYKECLRKDILPFERSPNLERNTVSVVLGSLVLLKEFKGVKKSEIELKVELFKNEFKVSQSIFLNCSHFSSNCSSYTNSSNYNNYLNSSKKGKLVVKNNKCYFQLSNSYLSANNYTYRVKRGKLINWHNKLNKREEEEVKLKLKRPIIVNLNVTLVFKVRNLKKVIRNNAKLQLVVQVYVKQQLIGQNYQSLNPTVNSNSYNNNSNNYSRNSYSDGEDCNIILFPNFSTNTNNNYKDNNYKDKNSIDKVLNGLKTLLDGLHRNEDKLTRIKLYKHLQFLFLVNSCDSNSTNNGNNNNNSEDSCKDGPICLLTYSFSNSYNNSNSYKGNNKDNNSYNYKRGTRVGRVVYVKKYFIHKFKELTYSNIYSNFYNNLTNNYNTDNGNNSNNYTDNCNNYIQEELLTSTSWLRLKKNELLLFKVPRDFKALQILSQTSLIEVFLNNYPHFSGKEDNYPHLAQTNKKPHPTNPNNNMCDNSVNKKEEINILGKRLSYLDVNELIYGKYFSQLSRDFSSLILLLRFTDYSNLNQRNLLLNCLRQVSPKKVPSSFLPELLSADFVRLPPDVRTLVLGLLLRNLNARRTAKYFKMLLSYLICDVDDALFNFLCEFSLTNIKYAFSFYYYLLNPKPSSCDNLCNNNKDNYINDNYDKRLDKYRKYLKENNMEVIKLLDLEDEFIAKFRKITLILEKTKRKCEYRNRYLHHLLKNVHLISSNNSNNGNSCNNFKDDSSNNYGNSCNNKLDEKMENDNSNKINNNKINNSNKIISKLNWIVDRRKREIKLLPPVPLITDPNLLIVSIDYRNSYVYKSNSYPVILQLNTLPSPSGGNYSTNSSNNSNNYTEKKVENSTLVNNNNNYNNNNNNYQVKKLLIKNKNMKNDVVCVDLLNFVRDLIESEVAVPFYSLLTLSNDLSFVQFLENSYPISSFSPYSPYSTINNNYNSNSSNNYFCNLPHSYNNFTATNSKDAINNPGIGNNNYISLQERRWKKMVYNNFVDSVGLIFFLNYIFEIGDRHYENVVVSPWGSAANVDFSHMFSKFSCFCINDFLLSPHLFFGGSESSRDSLFGRNAVCSSVGEKFKRIFKALRRNHKVVLQQLLSSGLSHEKILRVESRFLLQLSGNSLENKLDEIVEENLGRCSALSSFLFNKWHSFTNLFK